MLEGVYVLEGDYVVERVYGLEGIYLLEDFLYGWRNYAMEQFI